MTHRVIWKSLNSAYQEFLEQQQAERIEQEVSEYEQDETERYGMSGLSGIKTLLATPLGLVSVNDSLSPFKHYDLWQFDTTRQLTNEVVEKLKRVAGIEALKLITQYKALVAVGLAFQFKNVRPNIEMVLRDDYVILDDVVTLKINKLKADLAKYASYQIIVQPNGEVAFSYLEKDKSNLKEYQQNKVKFEAIKNLSNALIIDNDNE